MKVNNVTYWFFEQFIDDNFCLLYAGNINDEITTKIIGLSEHHFESQEGFAQTKKKVSFLLAECFQNIIRHAGTEDSDKSKNINSGFFLARNVDDAYFITSGNLIKNENIAGLKEKLEKVNSLDRSSLRALHIDVLAHNNFSEKGGAGLGLIEIARKSGQKIEFVFDSFKANLSTFYNQVKLKQKEHTNENSNSNKFYISEAINYHKKMLSDGILIIEKGDFSYSSILPVLEILEDNLHNLFTEAHTRKGAYHILVELLQNISKYAIEKNGIREGIFLIRKEADDFIISAGNFVEEYHIDLLKSQIELLNSLDKKELKTRYFKALRGEEDNKDGGALIELIEVARRTKKPIQYSFEEPKSGMFFFTISATV